ncbi:MAG: hypothetical protein R2710_14405 [Acidimicrobiales bacterium]
MTDLTATIDTHLAAYCEPDRARRLELLEASWVADGVLLDPPFDGSGIDGIADLVDAVLQHYPAHRFERTTSVDSHHDIARYGWSLVGPDGSAAVTGVDIAEANGDGKLTRVVGFFGELTPAA